MDATDLDRIIHEHLTEHIRLYHTAGRCPGGFKPPARDELVAYCREKDLPLDVDHFLEFYGCKGWMIGKTRMKDWRLAAQRAVREGWCRAGDAPKPVAKQKLWPIPGKNCGKCKMPAVYKSSAGGFDHYYCSDHMPEAVKEKFE